jgi:hypothetical protein
MSTLRKRELLLESDINRQVLHLELQQIRHQISEFRGNIFQSKWKFVAPLAGVLVAWRFRRLGKFLKSGVGLLLVRKIWDAFMAWSNSDRSPVRR